MNRRDRGAVLIVVLLVIMALSGMGIAALWLTSANNQLSTNLTMRNQALYVAEAGIDRARQLLTAPVVDLSTMLRGTGHALDDIPTTLNQQTGEPVGAGAIVVDADGPLADVIFPPADVPRTGLPMGRYTVWIRNDTGECRINSGTANFTTDSNSTIVFRAVGIAPDGRTQAVLEVTMSREPSMNQGGGGGLDPGDICASGKNACDDNTASPRGVTAS